MLPEQNGVGLMPSAVRRWLLLNVNELTWIALVAGGVSLAGLLAG